MIDEIFSKYNSERIKVLPCATSFITSYPHHSCYMSIVGNDINYRYAILDAYFPLSFNATCHRLDFSIGIDIVEFMEHLPFLEGKFVDRKTIQQARIKYVNYIKDNIQSDYYVYLLVDYYYISADDVCYQKRHRIHDLFIYGYDDEKQVFLVKDFLNGSKYQHFDVTYDEMEQAASNLELERDWLRGIKSYRRKSMIHEEIFFHTSVLHEEIIKYIHGEISGYTSFNDIRRRQDYEYYYGINIYEQIMKECTYRFEQGSVMDTRCFHILFEHKKYLLHLCRNLNKAYQLNNAEEILKQIQSILNVTYILRNSSMAFNVNGNEKSYKNILKYLKKLRENEKNALTLLSENIWLTTQFQSTNVLRSYAAKENQDVFELFGEISLFSFAISLMDNYVNIIKPALEQGKIVVTHRNDLCCKVYTRLRDYNNTVLPILNELISSYPKADLHLYCNTNVDTVMGRIEERMKSGYTPSINEDYEHLTKADMYYQKLLSTDYSYVEFLNTSSSEPDMLDQPLRNLLIRRLGRML